MAETFTFRDRVKVACLQACIQQGMDEEEMIYAFKTAADHIRQQKTALNPTTTLTNLGKLGLVGLPIAALIGAFPGHQMGQMAANVNVGRLPSADEIKLVDETAAYERTKEEIQRRIAAAKEERERRNKPSVRRLLA